MLVSRSESVFNFSIVAGSSLANASSVGAKTVNSPPLRVSTRLTLGFSCPETALVKVVSIGLFDAATATGSIAIPATEPGPVGTFCAYAVHAGPTSSADAVLAVVSDIPIAAAAARPATAAVVLMFFICSPILRTSLDKKTAVAASPLCAFTSHSEPACPRMGDGTQNLSHM